MNYLIGREENVEIVLNELYLCLIKRIFYSLKTRFFVFVKIVKYLLVIIFGLFGGK